MEKSLRTNNCGPILELKLENAFTKRQQYRTLDFEGSLMDFQLKFQVLRSQEFNEWLETQTKAVHGLVLARLQRISIDGHFGFTNQFDGLIELKWKSGLRVYTARIGQMVIIVLGGGNKNGQSKDIQKAKKVLSKIKSTFIGSP